jgi:hypothetical protein
MSKPFLLTFLAALVVIGGGIGLVFLNSKAHVDPKGAILKVRTIKLDDKNSAAVVEIRLINDADYALVARNIETLATGGSGEIQGNIVAEMDVKTMYRYHTELGEQYNPVLKLRDQVPPKSSVDREVCAMYSIPVEELDRRKDMIVRVQDVTGPILEMHEKRR